MSKKIDKKKPIIIGAAAVILLIAAIVCIVIAIGGKEDPVVAGAPYDYEKSGNIELGDYKGVEISVAVSDEEVETEIESILEDVELYTENQGTPVEGDYICISYIATVDGNVIEDYSDENVFMIVGDEEIEADFDKAALTMSTGDTRTIDVAFPEDYGDELVDGKNVSYEFTIHYIAGDPIQQELTDEFVNEYTEGACTSTDGFDEYIKESLYQDNVDYMADSAWEVVIGNAQVDKYHKGELKSAEEETIKSYEEFAEVTGQDILETLGMTEDDIKDIAEEVVLERMVAKTIAAKENLNMSNDDYKNTLLSYLMEDEQNDELSAMSLEELENYYFEMYQENAKETMFLEYVKAFVADNAKVTGLK